MQFRNRRLGISCALLICTSPAFAYIDPGTGSALIQGIIAAIAAVSITAKLYWHRIVNFVTRKKKTDQASQIESEEE